MPGLSFFPGGSTLQIPLDAPTALIATAGNAKVSLTWTDPKDKYATPEGEQAQDPQQLVSVWAYTKIVRKAGSAPTGPNDGVAVVSSEVRNAYQTEPFVDTGVENDTTYYYGAFAYNEDFVVSEGAFSEGVTPKAISPVLAENEWPVIDLVCSQGLAPSLWEVGDETAEFNIGDETHTAVIIDFNHDDLSDGSGKAVISFSLKHLMRDQKQMHSTANSSGTAWSYPAASNVLKPYLDNTVYNSLPPELRNVLQKVKKTYGYDDSNYEPSTYGQNSADLYLFPFTVREVGGTIGTGHKPSITIEDGFAYPYFSTNQNRTKKLDGGKGEASRWWLGSGDAYYYYGSATLYYEVVSESGNPNVQTGAADGISATDKAGVCFGFCVGKAAA